MGIASSWDPLTLEMRKFIGRIPLKLCFSFEEDQWPLPQVNLISGDSFDLNRIQFSRAKVKSAKCDYSMDGKSTIC